MNRERRKAVAKFIRAYRKRKGQTRAEVAAALGWTPFFYERAERGLEALSEGQQKDVERLMQREIESARVRDRIREPSAGIPRRMLP